MLVLINLNYLRNTQTGKYMPYMHTLFILDSFVSSKLFFLKILEESSLIDLVLVQDET